MPLDRLRSWMGGDAFWVATLALFVLTHAPRIADPPAGYHKWRESDTAMVAENFATESWNLLEPRVHVRGAGDGVTGMELPLYSYTTAILWRMFGHSHTWPRALSVLGGVLLLLSTRRLVRELGGDARLANLTAFAASASPLLWFYSRKIQPDVWSLALAVTGVVGMLEWERLGGWRRGVVSCVAFTLGAMIKPTMLGLGLPLAVALWRRGSGPSFLRRPRLLAWGAACLGVTALWYWHAHVLAGRANGGYFYLGDNVQHALTYWLRQPAFYRNVFLTWPFELVVGLVLLPLFVVGLARTRREPGAAVYAAWMAGALVVCALSADHCATAHDYYVLPFVVPMAFVVAVGARAALDARAAWANVAALVLLVAASVFAPLRMAGRFGEGYDFVAGRQLVKQVMAPGARVIAYDAIPGYLLYRTGTKGWFIPAGGDSALLADAIAHDARYLVVDPHRALDRSAFDPWFELTPLLAMDGVAIYARRAP